MLITVSAWSVELSTSYDRIQRGAISIMPSPIEMEAEIDPDEYIVGVGDQFMIEKIQEQIIYLLPILPTGVLSIPGVATINIGGKTLTEAIEIISEKAGPYSNISLYDIKNIRVPVVGAVINPGIYSISAAWRLSDLLKKVPLSCLGKDHAIEIKSKNGTKIINIYDFYTKGDLKSNPYLHAGESIYIPFADLEKECIEVYGPVKLKKFVSFSKGDLTSANYVDTLSTTGLVPFIKGETLWDFYQRKIQVSNTMDYEKIVIVRDKKQLVVSGTEMNTFKLQAKDKIEFITLPRIVISGHVNRPGTYNFIPGHTVMDYIAMAGGVNYKGSNKSAIVLRDSKKYKHPEKIEIQRGDIILVKRSVEDILIGETSILSFISILATITTTVITAFIAAGSI